MLSTFRNVFINTSAFMVLMLCLFYPPGINAREGDDCTNPILVKFDSNNAYFNEDLSTLHYSNDFDCGKGHAGNDIVFKFHLDSERKVNFEVRAHFDADFALSRSCDNHNSISELGCWDVLGRSFKYSYEWGSFQLNNLTLLPGDYYFWIDGFNADEYGPFGLYIEHHSVTNDSNEAEM